MPHHIAPEVIIDGTLYTLLAFSVVTWTLILFKIWQFTKNSFYNRAFNKAFWDAANLEQAKTLPAEIARGPQARIAQQGFAWMSESQQSEGRALNIAAFRLNYLNIHCLFKCSKSNTQWKAA
jgi:hypothetical protein